MTQPVISGTPWEEYTLDGVPVYVKREDLCCPYPGPQFSKIRGVLEHIKSVKRTQGNVPIGVLDTFHSKAGWAVAYICAYLNMPCINFYPVYSSDNGELRYPQQQSQSLGATLEPMKATMSAVLYHKAKRQLVKGMTGGRGYMMPNALKLKESVDATATELRNSAPTELMRNGTWVVSVSSGTIAAGVLKGLTHMHYLPDNICLILHMGYSRSRDVLREYVIQSAAVLPADMVLVDEGFSYKDSVEGDAPFPCNPYYDLKAWNWLLCNAKNLRQPIVFWNIGA